MHRNRPSITWRPSSRRSLGNIGPSAAQLLMALSIVYGWQPCPSISAESAAATADSYWPRVASIEPPRTSPADRETPLQFAAGAVQFNLPAGWSARQKPHEREMRLVLRPPDAEREGGSVSEGLWMTYHAIARTEEPYPSELERWMPARLSPERDWSGAIGSPRRCEVDQWPALEQRFEFRPPASATTGVGRHLLVRTDWGIVELHASAPTPRADRLDTEVERLVSGLQLAAPLRSAESINNAACLATPVLGTWRSATGVMRLHGDARIEVVPDRPMTGALTRPGELQPSRIMTGRFAATQNTLLVTWEDGSQTNIRWMVVNDELRLVDHEGRASRLKRLME